MAYIKQSKIRTVVVTGMPLALGAAAVCDSCTLCSACRGYSNSRLSSHACRLAQLSGRRKAIQGGHYAAFFMRYTRQAQGHFNSAQSSREHEIVEAAEMSNPKSFSGELAQPRPQRHIEILKDDFAQPIRVVT